MKITILAYGSRGDVQPFVAAALGLRDAGHEVTLAAPEDFAGFIASFGLAFAPLPGSAQELVSSEEGQRWLASGDVIRFVRELGQIMRARWRPLSMAVGEACRGADLVVATALTVVPGLCWAEKRGVPMAVLLTCPFVPPTKAYPNFLLSARPLPSPWLNLATHHVMRWLYWRDVKPIMQALRAEIGLPPLRGDLHAAVNGTGVPVMHVISRHLLPPVPDWPANHTITGPLVVPSARRDGLGEGLDPALDAWLAAGEPPIFFGFGSMPVLDPAAMARMAAEAGERLGRRVLIGAGWSRYEGDLPAHVRLVAACDHELVFPRCAAVVHHGGAGTTQAALRAGTPALVCAVFADQPFWGERLVALGVGAHLPFAAVTADRLVAKLGPLLAPDVRARAEALAASARAEDGVAEVVRRLGAMG